MNALTTHATQEAVTMTSLELVDFINSHRRGKAEEAGVPFPSKGFAELQHRDFLRKVQEVLGSETCAKFFADLPDSYGRPRPAYIFPKREATLMAMSYSYELQAKVWDRMQALEDKLKETLSVSQVLSPKEKVEIELSALETLSRIYNLPESGKLSSLKVLLEAHNLNTSFLPSYGTDAPPGGDSSEDTASLTDLLREYGSPYTTRAYNTVLEALGFLATRTRPSTTKGTKTFKCVTEAGLRYGKNVTSPSNPRETQPHWYVRHFHTLNSLVMDYVQANG